MCLALKQKLAVFYEWDKQEQLSGHFQVKYTPTLGFSNYISRHLPMRNEYMCA